MKKNLVEKNPVTQKRLLKQIERFEKDNPSIAQAMKILDMSLARYQEILRSLETTKTYTSNSTQAVK